MPAGRRRGQAVLAQRLRIRLGEIDVDHDPVAAVEERGLAAAGVIDQLMRQNQVARADTPAAMPPTEATARIALDAALLQRPEVGAVVDPVRRDRVAVAVARQKDDVAAGDLAEQQRRRRLAVGRANDFAVGDGERGQAGKPAATDDGEHGLAIEKGPAAADARNARRATCQLLLCSTLVILVN